MASVLVIDDDGAIVETFSRMLRLEGFQVYTATSASAGLAEAEQHTPDAVLLDLRMPVMDGLEFLQQLRGRAMIRATPVVIVTGDYLIDESTTSKLERLGAHIAFKPLWLDDLVKLATTLIDGREEEWMPGPESESPVAAARCRRPESHPIEWTPNR